MRTDRWSRSRGQAAPLALLWLFAATALVLGLVRVGVVVSDRAHAQAAADAVALAAAAAGEPAAASIAQANRVQLLAVREVGDDVVVQIQRRGVTATARARWVPGAIP